MLGIKWGLLSSFVVFLTFFFLFSAIVVEKKQSPLKRSFLRFIVLYILILFGEVLLRLPFTQEYHNLIARVGNICFVYTGLGYLDFTYQIYSRPRDRFTLLFAFLGAISLYLSLQPDSLILKYVGNQVLVMPSKAVALSMLFSLVGPVIFAIFVLLRNRKKRGTTEEQNGLNSMLLKGTVLSVFLGFGAMGVIPLLLPQLIDVFEFTSLSALLIAIFLYIAVKRYHFNYVDVGEIEKVSRALFETVSEGVVIFNRDGEIRQLNREAEKLLGPVTNCADVELYIEKYAFNESTTAFKTSLERAEKNIPVLISQSEIRDGDTLLGRILIIHDIYNEVQLEKERLTMQERIRQSEKLESLGQLAGGVAHDFNNQLTGIIGCAEFLKTEVNGRPEAQSMLDQILKSAQSSADLTSKLLAFARKGKYTTNDVNLHESIQEVENILKRTIDKRIEIELELTAKESIVIGDRTQLQNALLNLALNACDAMEEKGGTLSFFSEVLTAEEFCILNNNVPGIGNNYISISVSDTGTGMTEETRKRIFEPFFTTKGQGKGTGMGLAAVYGTVVNHNGTIVVNSILGQGTSFNLLLPLAEEVHKATLPPSFDDAIVSEGAILLVDDEPLILKIGRRILEKKGFQVTTCDSGIDALDLVKERPAAFDLIILDLIMPDLRGDEIHKHIRTLSPSIPILIASGYSEDGVAHDLLLDEETSFLQKPFMRDTLLQAVHSVLSKSKTHSAM